MITLGQAVKYPKKTALEKGGFFGVENSVCRNQDLLADMDQMRIAELVV